MDPQSTSGQGLTKLAEPEEWGVTSGQLLQEMIQSYGDPFVQGFQVNLQKDQQVNHVDESDTQLLLARSSLNWLLIPTWLTESADRALS